MEDYDFNPLKKYAKHCRPINPKSVVASRTDLIASIAHLDDSATSQTTSAQRLHDFEDLLFFSSIKSVNPMMDLRIIPENVLLNNKECINIFYTLYHLFTSAKYLLVEQAEKETIGRFSSIYKHPSFYWQVPYTFMPIFLSCIIAVSQCQRKRSKATCTPFFENLKSIFPKALKLYFNMPESLGYTSFCNWLKYYLDAPFYKNLNTMLDTYSRTPQERELLLQSVDWLFILIRANKPHNPTLSASINKLLEAYMKSLEKIPLAQLYPHTDDWNLNDENMVINDLISWLLRQVNTTFISITKFIEEHHVKNAKYDIRIHSCDIFIEAMDSVLEQLYHVSYTVKAYLYHYFSDALHAPDIEKNIQKGILSIDSEAIQKHIDSFYCIIDRYLTDLIETLTKFKKIVTAASGSHPENYKSLKVNESYMKNLKDSLTHLEKSLNTKLEKEKATLPAPLHFYNPGYLKQSIASYYEFSQYKLFESKDILWIIHALSPCKIYSSEALTHMLTAYGYVFPLKTEQLIHLLGNEEFLSQL